MVIMHSLRHLVGKKNFVSACKSNKYFPFICIRVVYKLLKFVPFVRLYDFLSRDVRADVRRGGPFPFVPVREYSVDAFDVVYRDFRLEVMLREVMYSAVCSMEKQYFFRRWWCGVEAMRTGDFPDTS